MNSMDKTREFLRSIGLPGGDAYDLPTSNKRFKDGGQYRFEVPGIQGPKVMQALLEAMDGYGLYLHRVTQTQGIMRLTDQEIGKMVELAHTPPTPPPPSTPRRACAWATASGGRSRSCAPSRT